MKPVRPDHLHLFEHDDNETIIGESGRHPIGMVVIFFNGLFLLFLVLTVLFFGISQQERLLGPFSPTEDFDASGLLTGIAIFLAFLLTIGTFLAAYVYAHNYVILTDRKVVFISTRNIFARRISQLSIGDVQDVTIAQDTFLSRVFKYGTVNIETAGEQANFSFAYAALPFETAKAIVDAHEKNLELYGN